MTTNQEKRPNLLLKYFKYDHLPASLQVYSRPFYDMAHMMEANLPDGPEKTVAFRKLLEAKDCAIRSTLP